MLVVVVVVVGSSVVVVVVTGSSVVDELKEIEVQLPGLPCWVATAQLGVSEVRDQSLSTSVTPVPRAAERDVANDDEVVDS